MKKADSKIKKKKLIFVTIICAILAALLFILAIVHGILKKGERQLKSRVAGQILDMSDAVGCVQKDGLVMYKGQMYEYDVSNINILCMGIDARGDDEKVGQADMIAILVFNPEKDSVKCVCINRDSIGPVDIYGVAGKRVATENVQIALAYSYGKKPAEGRKLESSTVSRLLYGLPVHGSVSADIDGIGQMNELAGGVTLETLEDIPRAGIKKGETLTLDDEQALYYVTERDSASSELGTNGRRMNRQKQYISAWCEDVQGILKKNPLKIKDMYDSMVGYIDTDLTEESILYLTKTFAFGTGGLAEEDIYTVLGTYERENYYDKYVVDEEKLTEMMIDIFYKKVE